MTRLLVGWTLATGLVTIVGLAGVLPTPWVEGAYGLGLYPVIERALAPATAGLTPSLSAILLTASAPLAAVWLLLTARRRPGRALLSTLVVGATLGAWFYLAWGLNYQRRPLEDRLSLPPALGAEADLSPLARALAATVAAEVEAVEDVAGATAAVASAIEEVTLAWSGSAVTVPRRTKALPRGLLLTFGFAGMISPFLLEAHHDGGLPPAAVVSVGAHELAHLAGFAREAEAELVSAAAGLRAAHPYARYALALGQLGRILPGLPEEVRAELRGGLPDRALADLALQRERAQRYGRPWLAAPLNAVYDRYLRAQGTTAGTADYQRGSLLLARAWVAGLVAIGPEEERE